MNRLKRSIAIIVFPLLLAAGALAQDNQGTGEAVVTVLPKHEGDAVAPSVANQDLSIKVNGKNAKVTRWEPFKSPGDRLELVLLIDDSARSSLGTQLTEIADFVKTLPPNTKAAIAYMENGRAVFSGALTADHARALQALHLPIGEPGYAASPYFCLSSLAKSWPSSDPTVRREVLMITDGVDEYERQYDPDDPYVQSAINDSIRAHLIVYSIYWASNGRADRGSYQNNAGQNLLLQLDEATGGKSYWEGLGNPVTLAPYFDDLSRRFNNQYELQFTAGLKGKPEVETLKVKSTQPDVKVDAPQRVAVTPQIATPQ